MNRGPTSAWLAKNVQRLAQFNREQRHLLKLPQQTSESVPIAEEERLLRCALLFVHSSSAGAAIRQLPPRLQSLDVRLLHAPACRAGLFLGFGCLRSLTVIAKGVLVGHRLIVEDGTFARRFLSSSDWRQWVELVQVGRMPRLVADVLSNPSSRPTWFVAFPDRRLAGYQGAQRLDGVIGSFYFSPIDSLLCGLPFTTVLMLAEDGQLAMRSRHGEIEGATESEKAQADMEATYQRLQSAIMARRDEYLAWPELYSRSAHFRRRLTHNGRSIVRSFVLSAWAKGLYPSEALCVTQIRILDRLQMAE